MNLKVIVVSFLSGLLGSMGFGGGSVLVVYLTAFNSVEQKEAQGINLIFFICTSLFALLLNKKKNLIVSGECKKLIPMALLGLITGFLVLPYIPSLLLKRIFGGVLIILALKDFFIKKSEN